MMGHALESFFKTLKQEHIDWQRYKTREEAAISIVDFIDYYNHRRLHSALGYRTAREWIITQYVSL